MSQVLNIRHFVIVFSNFELGSVIGSKGSGSEILGRLEGQQIEDTVVVELIEADPNGIVFVFGKINLGQ